MSKLLTAGILESHGLLLNLNFSIITCETLSLLLNLFEPQFYHLWNGDNNSI